MVIFLVIHMVIFFVIHMVIYLYLCGNYLQFLSPKINFNRAVKRYQVTKEPKQEEKPKKGI